MMVGELSIKTFIEVFLFLVYISSPASVKTASDLDRWDILDISAWFNASTKYTTVYESCDPSIIESVDQQGQFYVVGGYQAHYGDTWHKIQKIDANHQTTGWIELKNITIPDYLATTHAGLFVQHHRLYVLTGQIDYGCGHATRAAAYLDMSTGNWIRLPDVPEARYAPATIVIDNRIHLFAGAKPDRTTPAHDYWILDLDHLTRGWINGSTLPFSGDHGRASLIDGWIYFYSFEHGHSSLDTTHTGVWDRNKKIVCPGSYIAQPQVMKIHLKHAVDSSQWTRLSDMARPVNHATSLVLDDRWIMVIGGISHEADRYARNIQLFDTITNRWRLLSPLPEYGKLPLVWMGRDQSALHLQTRSLFRHGQTQQAHIIWSQQPQTQKCLFYTDLNCTTRQLARTPFLRDRQEAETRWNQMFSYVYLMNMPIAVERLRRVWNELNKIDLTSITMLETFKIQNLTNGPVLIREDVLWPSRINDWKKKNDTRSISHLIRSDTSIKLMFMNLWTRNIEEGSLILPIMILEDDVRFLLSKDETFRVLSATMTYLQTHPDVEWDLVYMSYRNIEASRAFEVSKDEGIYLWRASQVFSNTAFIINQRPGTVARLNKCYLNVFDAADQAISQCLKSGLLRAFVIEPKLAQTVTGFSYNTNRYEDYGENNPYVNVLGNHTPPAKFNFVEKNSFKLQ